MHIVQLRDVNKVYKNGIIEVEALKNINLNIKKGDFTVLAGPSGSGKTTLLNIIGAMDKATSGEVIINNINIEKFSKNDASDFRRDRLGFIFQNFNLIPVLTVYENVEFSLDLIGSFSKSEKQEKIMEILKELDILELRDRKPSEISGGQQQRVAIARALVKSPDIIIADEPTANLDSKTGETIIDLMKKFNEEKNITFIFSSHDSKIIERAEEIVYLKDGFIENLIVK